MKACTKCGVEKQRSEFYKNSGHKDGLSSMCRLCAKKYEADRRAANPERAAAYKARWHQANKEKSNAKSRAWRAANLEKARDNYATWRHANPEKARAYTARWAKNHPEKVCAGTMRYLAGKLRATPVWADQRGIELWYKGARIMTQLTGKPYHVDHVVPLKSKAVCGLHAPTNMQILPGEENRSKGNRYWPDMP